MKTLVVGVLLFPLACTFSARVGTGSQPPTEGRPSSSGAASKPVAPAEPAADASGPWVVETFPTRGKPGAAKRVANEAARQLGYALDTTAGGADQLALHFLDVGQGQTTVIECPNGNIVIVDAGGSENPTAVAPPETFPITDSSKASAAKQAIDGLIDGKDVEALVLTHPDRDHYNGLGSIVGDVTVKNVFMSGTRKQYKAEPAADWLAAREDVTEEKYRGDPKIDCGDATITVYTAKASSAKGDSAHARNTLSLVLVVAYGQADFVLAADATKVTKKDILAALGDKAAAALDAEVLELAHHGSDNTLHAPWLDTVGPDIAVISAMVKHAYGHPRKAVIDALLAVPVAKAESHPLSSHDGGSCSKVKREADGVQLDLEDCRADRWTTSDLDRAIFSLGDIGTLVMTTDGETITTKYAKPAQQSSSGKKSGSKAKTKTGTTTTEKFEISKCSTRCQATSAPCSNGTGSNGKYKITCHTSEESSSYKKCADKNAPEREQWSQCHK